MTNKTQLFDVYFSLQGEPLRNVKGAVCYREEQFQQALKQQSHDIAEPFGLYM